MVPSSGPSGPKWQFSRFGKGKQGEVKRLNAAGGLAEAIRMSTNDEQWMSRALALAERGRGFVEPNPLVGAVVVRDGQLVGEGWHERFGAAHAEVNALTASGAAARGATLYVTLEPCCHHGKTPPCTDAVLRAGIHRVVAAMLDPFPQVAGQGMAILRAAGVTVDCGVLEAEARRLNAPYLTLLEKGRPYVLAKWAMTLDGKIATRTGDSRWISNEESRRRVHQLRGRMDAILVGISTVLTDNPQLTARPPGPRTATRIVLDRRCRLPLTSALATTARLVPTLVATSRDAPAEAVAALEELGCEVWRLPDIGSLLAELARRRMTNLLVEGGSGVLGSFFDARLIDEVHVFLAPRLVGGAAARTPISGNGVVTMAQALSLADWTMENVAGDLYIRGAVR
jgi:diaminohydroxyphosphoribosylaminopyrimidine deaminase/5-amino-6-(5-phosphoribosylamino)uracil reductase